MSRAVITKEDRDRRIKQIQMRHYTTLMRLYKKYRKAGHDIRAANIALILHNRFGVGDLSQGKHYS